MDSLQLPRQLINGANLSDSLVQAARAGHLETVNVLLARGINPDAPDNDGLKALEQAARNGHLDVVNILLENGADPDANREVGSTALRQAAVSGHIDIVKTLLAHGAKPGNSPGVLVEVIGYGYLAIIEALLAHGADPDAYDNRGRLALREAFYHGRFDIVNALLDKGACPKEIPMVLVDAAYRGHLAIVKKLLVLGADPNDPSELDLDATALALAAGSGHMDIVNILLEYGADPNAPYVMNTALIWAIESGHIDIIGKLLANGARLYPDALVVAAGKERLDVVNFLLENGADPDAYEETSNSALCRAVSSGCTDIVKTLLANGAEPEISPEALVAAVRSGRSEIVRILLANGARADTPDRDNRTAIEEARLGRYEKIVNVLENHIPEMKPYSLLTMARTCIRGRLTKRQRDGVQSLSSSVAELPLPKLLKRYVYGPLMPEADSPEEVLENIRAYTDSLGVYISL